jgi:predicted O-methyltransferase YrrM
MRKQADSSPDIRPDEPESMISETTHDLLRRYACEAGRRGTGTVVEIGAYRGSSTIALASGIRDAGRGRVVSIDPHREAVGIYGGVFSEVDHAVYLNNLERFGVSQWVEHLCMKSKAASENWTSAIDLLWIDGDHSYAGVTIDIQRWTPLVGDQGIVIFDDVEPGGEVEAAIRDYLPFARFRLVEQLGKILVLRKDSRPRTLYLCGGMQSSGSTLISWCFLQRRDLDGVLDMDNALIQQDFSRIKTDSAWLKMTIGAFRLAELASLFAAQGWEVRPLLVKRNLQDVIESLHGKPYGFNGVTGEEPPILIRVERYLADLEAAKTRNWPIIDYERLITSPKEELSKACAALSLPWDDCMMTWSKDEASIAYMANGNPTFMDTKKGKVDLLTAIARLPRWRSVHDASEDHAPLESWLLTQGLAVADSLDMSTGTDFAAQTLAPARYLGTRRQKQEYLLASLRYTESQYHRILNHALFGRLLKLWRNWVNPHVPARD